MNTIHDTDYLTATMRIRALEKRLFDREKAERLLEARNDEDAIKMVADAGYGEMQSLTSAEINHVLSKARSDCYEMIASMSPNPALTDVFRVKYDYHNAKALLKGEAVGEDITSLLLPSGRIPPKTFADCFTADSFTLLPDILRTAVLEARELLSRTADPQRAELCLDKAQLQEMQALALASESAFLQEYVRLFTDVYNLRALVRSLRLGKDTDFLRRVLSPGGDTDEARIVSLAGAGQTPSELFGGALSEAAQSGDTAAKGEGSLTAFEKRCDDALLAKAGSARYVAFGEQPLIGYLCACEADMTMLRTVLTGRAASVPPSELRERMRAVYA